MGSRWFFLPWLPKPGQQPLSWVTLGMMQGGWWMIPQWIWSWGEAQHQTSSCSGAGSRGCAALPTLGRCSGSSPVPAMP